ncbi:serine hydrolase domain-containing protein [Streptomyces sp. NPDC059076]|uniref:serine hydrolase domain-containing protein n=1 Tax=unclassified Streptomyces TaxID=2593676 RepID=UPI0036B5CD01
MTSDRVQAPDALLERVAAAAPRRAATVIAVSAGGETTTFCQGFTDRSRREPVTDRTRFELGSVTKTFTALLFADMVARGTVSADEPLSARVPRWALPRGPAGADITLEQLATHTSGLPRLPPGLLRTAVPSWTTNPYRGYPPGRLLESLARTRVDRAPGIRVRYSNFGVGLLGHLLAEQDGTEYGALLNDRVLGPLGMLDTTADPGEPQATGHWHGRPRPPFVIPGLPGAGVLRSSARDLLHYLHALISPPDHTGPQAPLRTALREVALPRSRAQGGPALALAWSRHELPGGQVMLSHSGATRGFSTFIGFSQDPAVAVVALANVMPNLRLRYINAANELLWTLVRRPSG